MAIKNIFIKNNLSSKVIRDHILRFLRINNFNSQYIDIIVKISGDNNSIYYSLSRLITLDLDNLSEKVNFVDSIEEKFNNLSEEYDSKKSLNNKIIIYWKDTDSTGYRKYHRNINLFKKYRLEINEEILPIKNIPFNTNYLGWGNIKHISSNNYLITEVIFDSSIKHINVNIINNYITELSVYYLNNEKTLVFTDHFTKKDKIKRSFNVNEVIFFEENNPFFMLKKDLLKPIFKLDKKGKPTKERLDIISTIKPSTIEDGINKEELLNRNIVTFDIETYKDSNNIFNILSVCFYNGDKFYKFYITDYKNTEDLLNDVFNNLFTSEFNDSFVYIHNGSNFDLVFLVKYLLSRNDVELTPVYKDAKFISLTIKYGKDKKSFKYELTIRDSMLLLLSSLYKLGKAFEVDVKKDIYPYEFPNVNNLNYIGDIPEYKFFDNKKVSLTEYTEYVNRFKGKKWSLKIETLNYCILDCISLYQILIKFKILIYNKFGVDILTCPTLPSLAFKIFRLNYLHSLATLCKPRFNIPLFNKAIYENLKEAYFGGHVDMYIPKGPIDVNLSVKDFKLMDISKLIKENGLEFIKNMFKTLKHYDVNSLYPSVMFDYKYPTELIAYFVGDISLIEEYKELYNNNLGVFHVKVKAPNIKNPLLPVKYKNTCLYPYGSWEGWYNSNEIKNAEIYGYQFEILGGYLFKPENIFGGFISELNKIKEASQKGSAMYLIAKILMNSLYGRFGLNPFLNKHLFIPKQNYDSFIKIHRGNVIDLGDFGSHILVSFYDNKDTNDRGIFANVAIASAIPSNARIEMSYIKNRNDIILFYSDTDSAIINCYLPDFLVDNKVLGKWKLEAEYLLFIALGPKVYGAIDIYGNSYTKVKGFKDIVDIKILESLLNKDIDKIDLTQKKWFKKITSSEINENEKSPYSLRPSNNKRILIYDNNILISTNNIKLINGEKVNN